MACKSLTSVTIPNSVATIGEYAFGGCTGLTSVTIVNDDPTKIALGDKVFKSVPTSTCVLYVPEGSKTLYSNAAQWKDFTHIEEFDITGIDNVLKHDDAAAQAPYYDLTGRRADKASSGIYIHAGKKVFVK